MAAAQCPLLLVNIAWSRLGERWHCPTFFSIATGFVLGRSSCARALYAAETLSASTIPSPTERRFMPSYLRRFILRAMRQGAPLMFPIAASW